MEKVKSTKTITSSDDIQDEMEDLLKRQSKIYFVGIRIYNEQYKSVTLSDFEYNDFFYFKMKKTPKFLSVGIEIGGPRDPEKGESVHYHILCRSINKIIIEKISFQEGYIIKRYIIFGVISDRYKDIVCRVVVKTVPEEV